ncbi:DVUA0089 family protein [Thalassotalea marina]|uniref:Ice-binding protein C-terminal domain-containing protein n=1 Tax=Thalassotalea marina TaxID=1673741 RepID=A0A919EP31_9GAMM|nr:DVUA0089 family protein [Thalassotalea marina]GHG04236.1 hypothetical protein GCM10017161_37160 [Thalassotalea marina]
MKKLIVAAALLLSFTANATLITSKSFTGNFDNDESRYYIQFDVTADNSTVDFTSWGYAGGVNAAGTVIADGGFDSQLFIFDSANTLLDSDDDSSTVVSASSNLSYDALISLTLDTGRYFAVLTQYNSDYISGDLLTGNWQPAGLTNFNGRTSFFAFDISGENLANIGGIGHDVTPVSEPGTLALFALTAFGFAARRKLAK